MSALPEQYLSLEEYFKLEETSDNKHEYYQGMIFAMTEAKEEHNLIAVAVLRNLDNQLDDKPYRPYPSDFRLKIEAVPIQGISCSRAKRIARNNFSWSL